jgi:hypothetical protein
VLAFRSQHERLRRNHVAAVAAPARDRIVHCSIGLNAPGLNADEQVAGQS